MTETDVTSNMHYPIYCRATKLADTKYRPQAARWSPREGERDGEWEGDVSGAVRRTTGMFCVGETASSVLHTSEETPVSECTAQMLPRL